MCSDSANSRLSLRRLLRLVLQTGVVLTLLAACSGADTPEQQIRALIDEAEAAVEARSVKRVMALVSEAYGDEQGRSGAQLGQLLAFYLRRQASIHLLLQVQHITLTGAHSADATVYVAMAGRPLTSSDQLTSLRADLFRFDIGLRNDDGDWQVHTGRWRPASQADFFE